MKRIQEISELPTDGEHFGIIGITNDGKTWFAETHKRNNNADCSIVFNWKNKKRDNYDIEGLRITGDEPEHVLKDAIKDGKTLLFDCHWKLSAMNQQLHSFYTFLSDLAEDELPDDFTIRMYIDEAHELGDALDRVVRDGSGHQIFISPISQKPKDLGTGAGSQIEEWVVLSVNQKQKTWFKQKNYPFSDIQDATIGEYYWAHFVEGEGVNRYDPIPAP